MEQQCKRHWYQVVYWVIVKKEEEGLYGNAKERRKNSTEMVKQKKDVIFVGYVHLEFGRERCDALGEK